MNGAEGHYPAQIHPSYYAAIITGEALGSSPSTQAYEITQASPQTGAFTNISAYAFLESDVLRRIVVINNDLYMSGDTSPRRSTGMSVDISTGGRSYKSMTIKRLSIECVLVSSNLTKAISQCRSSHSNDLSGLRWGNRTYETSSGLPAGTTFLETINITGKSVTPEFTLVASEAVLLSFISWGFITRTALMLKLCNAQRCCDFALGLSSNPRPTGNYTVHGGADTWPLT